MGVQWTGLPAFCFAVCIMFWSLPLATITGYLKIWQVGTKRNDLFDWARFLLAFFGVKVLKKGQKSLYRGEKIVYLGNHRSWGDFFLDSYLCEGRGNFIARWMVFVAFPFVMVAPYCINSIIFFKRGYIANKDKFNKWLDYKQKISPLEGMTVYPEGHRSVRPKSLPLKRGMLYYAYSRKLNCQIVLAHGKEDVLSEKTLHAGWGQTVIVSYGDIIDTNDYATVDLFFERVQREWDIMWEDVFSTNPKGLPVLVPEPNYYAAPLVNHVLEALGLLGTFILMPLFTIYVYKGLAWLAGSYAPVLTAATALLVAASVYQSAKPYQHCPYPPRVTSKTVTNGVPIVTASATKKLS